MSSWPALFVRKLRGQTILETHVNELQESLEALGKLVDPSDVVVMGPTEPVRVTTRHYYVDAYGAIGDGVADDTTPVQAAVTAAGDKGVVVFSLNKNYLITDTMAIGNAFTWTGGRSERGANFAAVAHAASAKITFRPVDTTKYLVSRFEPRPSALTIIGPFVIEDLCVDLGDANGFEFGREDLDGNGTSDPADAGDIDGLSGQTYVSGVQFRRFSLSATVADHASVAGVITRSDRYMVRLTKAFESVFEDGSLWGCDTQVRTWGCDTPTVRNVRSLASHLPLDFNGSGNYAVQHRLDGFQVEGYTFTPLRMANVQCNGSLLRFEQVQAETGMGRFAMAQTAAVTAGSATLTFSASVAGILFPGLSIIEVVSGANADACLVKTVSGATVTVETEGFAFDWTAAAATVTRIHGYGPIKIGTFDAGLSDVSLAVSPSTPHFVMAGSTGVFSIANAARQAGDGGSASLPIGNKLGGAGNLNAMMQFANCGIRVIGDPAHPLVRVVGWRENHGGGQYDAAQRGFPGDLAVERAHLRRAWVYTPKSGAETVGALNTKLWKPLAGDADTLQTVWAWKIPNGEAWQIVDATLPNIVAGRLRVRIRARTATGTGTLVIYEGNGFAVFVAPALDAVMRTHEFVIPVPVAWTTAGGRTAATLTNFYAIPTFDCYIAGIEIEETGTQDNAHGVATVANGATIAHGLGVIPTWSSAGGTVAGRIANVTVMDATNLTISLTDHAGTAIAVAEPVRWRAEV